MGNMYSDEILFQAGLHPRRFMQDMTEDDLERLYAALRKVLETAIDAQADPQQMPDDFLLPQRHKDGHCPNCKRAPETLRVGGRTAWFCPSCQAH
ncbi:MAG: zinc finger domain-containing protein [Thiogranum sp.]|nr:zinc finger domain-containing protein [Thiogranum sp.]